MMKKLLLLVAVIICVGCSASVVSAEPAFVAEIDPMKAAAFGIYDLSWIETPKTDDDYLHNFLLSYLAGQWDYIENLVYPFKGHEQHVFSLNARTCNTLLGAFSNQNDYSGLCLDGNYYIITHGIAPAFTKEEAMEQLEGSFQAARDLRQRMYDNGTLRADMAGEQKCSAYMNALKSLYILPSKAVTYIDYNSKDPAYRTRFMLYDSAYAALVNRVADCGGNVAALNLLLGLDSIRACGLKGTLLAPNSGHLVSYLVLGDVEYIADNAGGVGLHPLTSQTVSDQFRTDRESLTAARRMTQKNSQGNGQ